MMEGGLQAVQEAGYFSGNSRRLTQCEAAKTSWKCFWVLAVCDAVCQLLIEACGRWRPADGRVACRAHSFPQ